MNQGEAIKEKREEVWSNEGKKSTAYEPWRAGVRVVLRPEQGLEVEPCEDRVSQISRSQKPPEKHK